MDRCILSRKSVIILQIRKETSKLKLKLVIFDMDGLVFDSERVYFKGNQLAAKELGMDFSFAYYRQYIGSGTKRMIDKMTRDYGNRQLIEKFIELSHQNVFKMIKQNGLPLKKGFRELSQYLRNQGIMQVLASSNDRQAIELFLHSSNLDNNFAHLISGEDVKNSKPAPDIFRKAWEIAGSPARKQVLVLEDSVNGIKAAHHAQLPAIMVPDLLRPTNETQKLARAILPDLSAVCAYIKA